MNIEEARPEQRVIYVPPHAKGLLTHSDCEKGTVSSSNDKYIFVKFDKQVERLGWKETTSQACDPVNLVLE